MNNGTTPTPRIAAHTARVWLRAFGAILLLLCADARHAYAVAITLGSRIDLTPTTFALPVEITDAVGVSEWFLDLTYDPTDVQVNLGCDPFGGDIYCSLFTGPVTEGDFFAAGAPFNLLVPGFVELDPNTLTQAGRLFGMHGAYGGIPPAPSGSGILAYIEFMLLGTGDSPIGGDGTVVAEPVPVPVPEPGTLALLAAGFAWLGARGIFMRGRRQRPQHHQEPGEKSMNVLVRFRSPQPQAGRRRATFACGVLASLVCGGAAAQILPPTIDPTLPVLDPSPPTYPATVAPTAVGPYYARPAWSQTLAANVRFVVLSNFFSDAVLDRETGLVWARRGRVTSFAHSATTCRDSVIGNRQGWRLPTLAELQTLLDYSVPASAQPRLQAGHPFVLPSTDGTFNNLPGTFRYWTSELIDQGGSNVFRWSVSLDNGVAQLWTGVPDLGVLCVRGSI